MKYFYLLIVFMIYNGPQVSAKQSDCPRLATTTSVHSSGLLDIIIPMFEKEHQCTMLIKSIGTGAALRLARQGQTDVLLVHAPSSEKVFIEKGYGRARIPIMNNQYLIAGPASDPAQINEATTINMALERVAQSRSLFLSRGDDSGTHKKERILWKGANIIPYGSWYYETGSGMGQLIRSAEKMQGYFLLDKGSWLNNKQKLTLKALYSNDEELRNDYSVIAVLPRENFIINQKAANFFIQWIISKDVQTVIGNYKVDSEYLFDPVIKVQR